MTGIEAPLPTEPPRERGGWWLAILVFELVLFFMGIMH